MKRKTEVSLESAISNIYLESSLKSTRNKKKAKLQKVSLTSAPSTPRTERIADVSTDPFPADNDWIDEDHVVIHNLERLPIRAKVRGRVAHMRESRLLTIATEPERLHA